MGYRTRSYQKERERERESEREREKGGREKGKTMTSADISQKMTYKWPTDI
jgi:hypothetical protein